MLSISSLFSNLQNITVSQREASSETKTSQTAQKTLPNSNSETDASKNDILDLNSKTKIDQFQALFQTYKPASQTGVSANAKSSQVETDVIEQIRINKNAVLDRINTLLEENGVEIADDQKFTININMQTGLIDVSGIEDEELQQQFLDAVQGDEQLTSLMRKTREDLALNYGENVKAGNFGIEFDSMLETPADAAISYRLDINIDAVDNTNATAETENVVDQRATTRYQISILMSNFIPEMPDLNSATTDQANSTVQQFVKGNMTSVQFSWWTPSENSEDDAEEASLQYNLQTWTTIAMEGEDGSSTNYGLFKSQTIAGLPQQLQSSNNVLEDWLSWLNGTNSPLSSLSALT